MRELPRLARMYLYASYALGLASLGWLVFGNFRLGGPADWSLAILLAALAGTAQVFVVARAGNNYSDHLTPAPLFAAFLLLPPPLLAVAVCLAFLPEWIWYRRKWFIQSFNVATWIIAIALGKVALFLITGQLSAMQATLPPAAASAAALIVMLLGQTILLALVLKLARGHSLNETGLFAPIKLFVETALFCSGWAFAVAWSVDPLYGIAAILPLGLIFQALHVPNLKEEATTDPKTGLANMRHFNHVLQRDLERAERNGQSFALMMCDLDYLRNINNTYGHQAGDVVLSGIANVIRHNIRGCDLAGRFGGEEFCILLSDTDSIGAREVAERLRREIEQSRFAVGSHGPEVGATISIGIALYPLDGRTSEGLMHEADLAVYQAKREGRNRVVIASRESRELAADWAKDNLVPVAPVAAPAGSSAPIWRFVADITRLSYNRPAEGPALLPPNPAHKAPIGDSRRNEAKLPPSDLSVTAGAFIAVVVVAGLGILAAGFLARGLNPMSWIGLVLFASLTILAQHLAIDVGTRGQTSVSAVAILAISFLYNDLGILVVVLAFAVWSKIQAHSLWYRALFNFGMTLLAAEGADGIFKLLIGGRMAGQPFERMIVPAVGAGLLYYAINHGLLSIVRGLTENRSPWRIWKDNYQWLWPYYAVFGSLALILALSFRAFGWAGVIVLMAPLAMMHLSIKQYMDRTAVHVNELQSLNNRLSDSYEATLQALSRALDTRDEETEEHSQRVRRYTELIARRYGLSDEELAHISRGALLHDLGKIGVPDAILLKPHRLTAEEHALMRKHPAIGYSMIAHIPFLAKAAQIVLHHHEAFDGTGYPSGLAGERIPLGARIFAVADTFDAMTSDRPYRKALPIAAALAEIERCRGQQFDPSVVDALLAIPIEELAACEQEYPGAERPPSRLFRGELQQVAG